MIIYGSLTGASVGTMFLGGIVPESDIATLRSLGVKAVFTPKDFDVVDVMDRILDVMGVSKA